MNLSSSNRERLLNKEALMISKSVMKTWYFVCLVR